MVAIKAKKKSVINGDVDESLFGTLTKSSTKLTTTNKLTKLKPTHPSSSTVSAAHLTTLTTADVKTIQYSLQSPTQLKSTTAVLHDTTNTAKLTKAAQHKAVIQSYEAERLKHQPMTEGEMADQRAAQLTLQLAKAKLDNQLDDVKTMNHMMNYAHVVSVRDAQVAEKAALQAQRLQDEAELDRRMEMERVRQIETLEQRDAQRRMEQRLGAKVIEQQIQQRENDRFMEQERKRVEAEHAVEYERKMIEAEKAEKMRKVEAGREVLRAVNEANKLQLVVKQQRKQDELLDDLRIQQYIQAKQARESDLEAEQQRIHAEKEYEVNRLRQMQEKAADRQSAIDELRARRYQEQKEREQRTAEQSEVAKRQQAKRDLELARQQQHLDKQAALVASAEADRADWERTMKHLNKLDEADEGKLARLQSSAATHRTELQRQIAEHESGKAAARAAYVAEGDALARQIELDRQHIEQLKQQKLAELEAAGVKGVYMHELRKKKILDSAIH